MSAGFRAENRTATQPYTPTHQVTYPRPGSCRHAPASTPQEYLFDALNTYTAEHLQMRISPKTLTAILHAATENYEATDDDHSDAVKMMHSPC